MKSSAPLWPAIVLSVVLVAWPAAGAPDLENFTDVLVEEGNEGGVEVQVMDLQPSNVDQWIFGRHAHQGHRNLETRLLLQIQTIDQVCGLSEPQRERLRLAGRGDIHRFFDEVERFRQEFMKVRHDPQMFNEIWQKVSPLQMKFNSGLFDDDSLFHKVVGNVLDSEQELRYRQSELERRRFRYQANVATAVAVLENSIPLLDSQRQELIQLIIEQTAVPPRFGQFDYYVVLYQTATLNPEKLRPIFDDEQWRALDAHLGQARMLEPQLRSHGLIP
jgi:hypothetical protein